MSENKKNVKWKLVTFLIATWVVAISLIGVVHFINITGPGYTFQNEVHSYMENAYYSADPYTMKTNILSARQGMVNLGLKENQYSAIFSWDRVPDKSMKWQYNHMDSILIRCDEFISWEQSQTDIGSQQMQDVYTQKLDNIRLFINDEGWSDWIANDCYYINNYLWIFLFGWVASILIVLCFIFTVYCIWRLVTTGGDKKFDEKTKKWRWDNGDSYF